MKSFFIFLSLLFTTFFIYSQDNWIELSSDTIIYDNNYEYLVAIETASYMESYVFYRSALQAFQNENFFSAKAMVSKAIKLNKDEAKFRILKAWVLSKESSYNKAIKMTNRILEENPKFQEAIYCKALNYYLLGNYGTAIKNYNLLLKIDPFDYKALLARAEAKMKLKDYNGAILDYTTTLLNKSTATAAYKGRALAYFNIYDFNNAVIDFNQIIVAQPENGQMYYYRGICYIKLSDFTSACKDFESAIRLNYQEAHEYLEKNCRL